MKLAEYAKAATAFLLTAYTGYQAARLGSSPAGEAVTVDEWVGLTVTALMLGLGVWLVPNTNVPVTVRPVPPEQPDAVTVNVQPGLHLPTPAEKTLWRGEP